MNIVILDLHGLEIFKKEVEYEWRVNFLNMGQEPNANEFNKKLMGFVEKATGVSVGIEDMLWYKLNK